MLPGDANPGGNVHGGTLMKLADNAGGMCAMRHARSRVVSVLLDSMSFKHPVHVGEVVTAVAEVTWTGRTSIETEINITAENVISGEVRHISTAYLVCVATDAAGRPREVPPVPVVTPEDRERWAQAEARRTHRLSR